MLFVAVLRCMRGDRLLAGRLRFGGQRTSQRRVGVGPLGMGKYMHAAESRRELHTEDSDMYLILEVYHGTKH